LYVGKDIYEVDIFAHSTANVCQENLVFSYNLLEECYVRTGLLSEVLLCKEFPNNYPSVVACSTCWIRGELQLLICKRFGSEKQTEDWTKIHYLQFLSGSYLIICDATL